jgi:glycosyltransferase involved in cell wall biosynthesis
MKPLISVVMSVYNAQKYLKYSIESILNQTYQNFEFIIINDGSTDRSLEIIEKYKLEDKRIVLISRENRGLIASLNEGIAISKGKYIARMDSDDISLPDRLKEQVEFMEKNEDIDVVGCYFQLIDKTSKVIDDKKVSLSKEEILMNLCYTVPFAHPSVMIRKEIFKKFQYENSAVEDYLLWTKIFNGNNFANLDKILFQYRYHYGESFSDSKRMKMLTEEQEISKKFIIKNKTLLKNSFNKVNKLNSYYCWAAANVIRLLNFNEVIKIIPLKKVKIFRCAIPFIIRHIFRIFYWKFIK